MAICTGSGRGQPAGQVVVDPPAQAGRRDQQAAPVDSGPPLPGQEHGAGEDRERPGEEPAVHVLSEQQPGDPHGRQGFEVQEQRGAGGVGAGEAEHQQQRPDGAADQDHQRQPRQVAAAQRSLGRREGGARRADRGEADAGAEVEQAGHHPRIDLAEQQLGEGRAGAEQEGGEERERDAGAVHWITRC
jgi:hypothetical protein